MRTDNIEQEYDKVNREQADQITQSFSPVPQSLSLGFNKERLIQYQTLNSMFQGTKSGFKSVQNFQELQEQSKLSETSRPF